MRNLHHVSILITMSTLAGCATGVEVAQTAPPRALKTGFELRRIAIPDFQGQGGSEVAKELEAELVTTQSGDKPYFTIIDRTSTPHLMEEFARGLRGEVNPTTAAKFGKQIG